MNKEWSELNKLMQTQIKKRDLYDAGIGTLFALRGGYEYGTNYKRFERKYKGRGVIPLPLYCYLTVWYNINLRYYLIYVNVTVSL